MLIIPANGPSVGAYAVASLVIADPACRISTCAKGHARLRVQGVFAIPARLAEEPGERIVDPELKGAVDFQALRLREKDPSVIARALVLLGRALA